MAEKGIIEFVKEGVCDYILITQAGKEWNTIKSEKNPSAMSEKNPSEVGKKSDILEYYNNTSSSNKENSQKNENSEFLLKNYTLESLKYNLLQKNSVSYETLKMKHRIKLDEVLQNFLTYHENKNYRNFDEIAKHLLNFNFTKSEVVLKEKNFAPKKENFYNQPAPKVYKQIVLTPEEQAEKRALIERYKNS